MNSRERDILQGMANCYATCGQDFENTVLMVARARGLTPEAVKATLKSMKARFADTEDYKRLREKLPAEFPL